MNERRLKVEVPEAHYTLFSATRGALPEVIVVNDALLTFRHTEVFPWHLWVCLEATKLGDNGMPTHDESTLLFKVGDRIEDTVLGGRTELGAKNAVFVARSTWNERRELHFQVHDPDIADVALKRMIASHDGTREWEYRMTHDPNWSEAGRIFQLFPLSQGADA